MAKKQTIQKTEVKSVGEIANVIVGQLAYRAGNLPMAKFTNKQAIETVCKAMEIVGNNETTDAQKKVAFLVAAKVAKNSDTAGEEVQRVIAQAFGV